MYFSLPRPLLTVRHVVVACVRGHTTFLSLCYVSMLLCMHFSSLMMVFCIYEKIFQSYVIQGVGMLNVMIIMIYHICSSKFLWSGMFVIQEVIRHVIMAVLLEIHVFHLRLTLLYRGIVLPSVCERFYNRQDSVAGCWFILFSMYFWQVLVTWKL